MENYKNKGILIAPPKPSDYIAGVNSKITINRYVKDWSLYLPANETQHSSATDFLDCVTMSGPDHSIATQLNYLLSTNQLPDEALFFFHNEGYIVDGVFSLSSRFNAKRNGTDLTRGQYLNIAADEVRREGFVSERAWPTGPDMPWDEFYAPIKTSLLDIAKKVLWWIKIEYQFIDQIDLASYLPMAPIQVATEICAGWESGNVVQKCSGQPVQHATLLYGADQYGNWHDFDQYPPFKQSLAKDYEFPLSLQYIISVKPLSLRREMNGTNVIELQKNLNTLGFNLLVDGSYGIKTEIAVKNIQNKSALVADGIAGPKTLARIASLVDHGKIGSWCEAIKQMEGAKPERNNPGNLRFIGQQYAVNDNGFCKFDTYEHGYAALKNLLVNACMGKSSKYNPNGSLYDFYRVYAPANDGNNPEQYAEFVARKLGVEPSIKISSLL